MPRTTLIRTSRMLASPTHCETGLLMFIAKWSREQQDFEEGTSSAPPAYATPSR